MRQRPRALAQARAPNGLAQEQVLHGEEPALQRQHLAPWLPRPPVPQQPRALLLGQPLGDPPGLRQRHLAP